MWVYGRGTITSLEDSILEISDERQFSMFQKGDIILAENKEMNIVTIVDDAKKYISVTPFKKGLINSPFLYKKRIT